MSDPLILLAAANSQNREPPRTVGGKLKHVLQCSLGICVCVPYICITSCCDVWNYKIRKRPDRRGWCGTSRLGPVRRQRSNEQPPTRREARIDIEFACQEPFKFEPPPPPSLYRPHSPRERKLTIMRASDVNEHHDVNSQKGSMLFSKLPPELRLLIYRYSLCGWVFHLEAWNEDTCPCLRAVRCTASNDLPSRAHGCWKYGLPEHPPPMPPLSLLLSCKRIYSEAVDSLYHNTFDFRDPKQFFKLPLLILPQRFHAIQSLQFDYCMGDGFDGQWDWPFNLWDLVASMKGLEQLRVRYLVGKDHQSYWFRFQDHYLQPLIEAEIAADVEIILPFAACERARIGKSNFRITIPEMDGYRMVEAERDV